MRASRKTIVSRGSGSGHFQNLRSALLIVLCNLGTVLVLVIDDV